MKLTDKILYWFYPAICAFCGKIMAYSKTGVYICPECMEKLRFCVNEKCCYVCGSPVENENYGLCHECFSIRHSGSRMYYDRIISVCVYDENSRNGIVKFKKGINSGSVSTFAGIIAAVAQSNLKDFDFVAAVPPRKKRMRELGFDQCHILALKIAKILNIPYVKNILYRTRNSEKQTNLSGEQRRENLSGAFEVKINPDRIKNKRILIIDDVKTTGSTINECARALKEKGAAVVCGATIATTSHDN